MEQHFEAPLKKKMKKNYTKIAELVIWLGNILPDWQVLGLRFQYMKGGDRGNTQKGGGGAEEKRKEEKTRIVYPILLFQNESGIKTFLLV